MQRKISYVSLFFVVLLFGSLFFVWFASKFFSEPTRAGASDNTSGFAWSENIGWISFNCTDLGSCGSVDYGVSINFQSGAFSGHAWSENIGWIKFNPTTTPPSAPSYSACLDLPGAGQTCDGVGDYSASGWARACAAVADKITCEGAADPAAGGWDGWIKMRCSGAECSISNYGVLWNSSTFELEGWAWSDMVIGWISFNCLDTGVCATSNYKVLASANQPPSPGSSADLIFSSTSSADPVENPGNGICARKTTLSWTYSDPDGNPQNAARVQVDESSERNFATPVEDITLGAVTSIVLTHGNDTGISDARLPFNGSWVWRVQVQDSQGVWSSWAYDDTSFTTILHDLPTANFTFTPSKPSAKEPIQFTDASQAFGGAVITSRSWQFLPDGSPGTSTAANPVATFPKTGFKPVILNVTDSDSFSCAINTQALSGNDPRRINMKPPLPKFFPVIPF